MLLCSKYAHLLACHLHEYLNSFPWAKKFCNKSFPLSATAAVIHLYCACIRIVLYIPRIERWAHYRLESANNLVWNGFVPFIGPSSILLHRSVDFLLYSGNKFVQQFMYMYKNIDILSTSDHTFLDFDIASISIYCNFRSHWIKISEHTKRLNC
ncbi:hypothetical protein ACJX0J_014668, partial [Zea mays]